jgi:hypothetical protein
VPQNDLPEFVYAVSDRYRCPTYPDGKIPLRFIYSDEADEHYILETIRTRLHLEKDRHGKVSFTYLPDGGKKTFEMHCPVRPDDDGEADIVFSTKIVEEKKEESAQRSANACKSSLDVSTVKYTHMLASVGDQVDRDRSRSRKSSTDTQNSAGSAVEDLNSRLAMAHLISDPRIHNLEGGKVKDIAEKLKLALSVLGDNT